LVVTDGVGVAIAQGSPEAVAPAPDLPRRKQGTSVVNSCADLGGGPAQRDISSNIRTFVVPDVIVVCAPELTEVVSSPAAHGPGLQQRAGMIVSHRQLRHGAAHPDIAGRP